MDILVFSPAELPVALATLKSTAANPNGLTAAESQFLTTLAILHGLPVVIDELPEVTPQQAAQVISSAHCRKRLVQLAIAFAMLSTPLSHLQFSRLQTLALSLSVHEPGLTVLHHLLKGRTRLARLLLLLRLMGRFFKAAWQEEGLRGLGLILGPLVFKRGGENPDLAQRFTQLQELPKNTLGYAFWQHCTTHHLTFPGHAGAIPERLVFHDFGHLLSGYDTDPMGEIQQGAFQAGFVREDGFAFLLFAILQFHWGVQITPVADAVQGLFKPEMILQALYRGSMCTVDLSQNWDFWKVLALPLTTVQQQYLSEVLHLPSERYALKR